MSQMEHIFPVPLHIYACSQISLPEDYVDILSSYIVASCILFLSLISNHNIDVFLPPFHNESLLGLHFVQVPVQSTAEETCQQISQEAEALSEEGTYSGISEGSSEEKGERDPASGSRPGFSEAKSAKGEAQLKSGNVVASICTMENR